MVQSYSSKIEIVGCKAETWINEIKIGFFHIYVKSVGLQWASQRIQPSSLTYFILRFSSITSFLCPGFWGKGIYNHMAVRISVVSQLFLPCLLSFLSICTIFHTKSFPLFTSKGQKLCHFILSFIEKGRCFCIMNCSYWHF